MKKIFVAAPAFNEAQVSGAEKIFDTLDKPGIEILPNMGDAQEQTLQMRLDGIKEADLVLVWLDGLLPAGIELHAVGGMKNQLQIQFPPNIQNLLDAGMAVTGASAGSLSGKRQAIILPGQAEQVAESPKGMQVALPPNVFVTQFLTAHLNLPAPPAVFEAGYAIALGKPVTALHMGQSSASAYFEDLGMKLLKSFEELETWTREIAGLPAVAPEQK